MNADESAKVGQASEPGEYDDGMQAMLQIIWGEGFLSPGGAAEISCLLEGSTIAGCKVLDVGCGLGAVDEILVRDYGAGSVVGIDIDPALLEGMSARIARAGLADRIRGVRVEPGPLPFAESSFDVVFSKDSLVQIPDKAAIFAEVLRVLKPKGAFIASDWLRGGSGDYSAEMMEFFRLEGIAYNMATLAESAETLRQAGFKELEIRDRHDWYLGLAQRELSAMEGPLNPVIVHRIGPERARHFIDDWRQLVVVLKRGELRPGHLKAVKPG
ncbi:MAG TPA: methyltransferase domain-containing protein [Steroidobacteraceae bacterium]|jgi:phosphoethanolamine N-methyltransferase|nr:methyltransferase domain-containing protein [Steroidobacteraceae bacterium]